MAKRYREDKQKLQIKGQTLQWPLYCMTFDLKLLFISSVSSGHVIVWPLICSFYLSRRYLEAIVLSDLRFVASVHLVGFFWPLYCMTFDLKLLFISSVSCGHFIVWPLICSFCLFRRFLLAIVLYDLRFVASIYLVGILWPLYCLTFDLLLLFIIDGQTIQWPTDTDKINRSNKSKVRQYNGQKIPTR
jgi:hypothetical protein